MTSTNVINLALEMGYIITQEEAEIISSTAQDDEQYVAYLIESQFDFK
jgi:hypothetical protein